jgi:hypothetical protein
MHDDMSSIPPRVGSLEMEVHTVRHRLTVLEDTHKEMPHRMTKVEIAVERLPHIDERLGKLEGQVAAGFNKLLGAFAIGSVLVSAAVTFGPYIIKLIKG